jgi:RNA polymerase sigma factor (sigma-70 family)
MIARKPEPEPAHDDPRELQGRSALSMYLSEIRSLPIPTEEQERRLREDLAAGDPRAIEHLVRHTLKFVVKIAMEYRSSGLPFEDLLNEGNVGLMEAVRRFDPRRANKFTTYAVWWIRKSILAAIQTKRHLIRTPARVLERGRRIREAEGELLQTLGRRPSVEELAGFLSETARAVERVLAQRTGPISLSVETGQRNATLEEIVADAGAVCPEEKLLSEERTLNLEQALAQLTPTQRRVLEHRFGLGGGAPQTLVQIGARLGVSRERIRQIEQQARGRLRRILVSRHRRKYPAASRRD